MSVNLFLPQVTRIPITGPEPYNTLVCVSVEAGLGSAVVRNGKLSHFSQRVFTPFRLMGFDQRVPPIFDHSTTAWISTIGPTTDGHWLYAMDSVTGAGFSPTDGTYYIDLMMAMSPSDGGAAPGTCVAIGPVGTMCIYLSLIQATSWVLCYEPPAPPQPQGHGHRFSDTSSLRDLLGTTTRTQITPPAQSAQAAAADRIAQLVAHQLGMSISLPGDDATSNPGSNGGAHASTSGCV